MKNLILIAVVMFGIIVYQDSRNLLDERKLEYPPVLGRFGWLLNFRLFVPQHEKSGDAHLEWYFHDPWPVALQILDDEFNMHIKRNTYKGLKCMYNLTYYIFAIPLAYVVNGSSR